MYNNLTTPKILNEYEEVLLKANKLLAILEDKVSDITAFNYNQFKLSIGA